MTAFADTAVAIIRNDDGLMALVDDTGSGNGGIYDAVRAQGRALPELALEVMQWSATTIVANAAAAAGDINDLLYSDGELDQVYRITSVTPGVSYNIDRVYTGSVGFRTTKRFNWSAPPAIRPLLIGSGRPIGGP